MTFEIHGGMEHPDDFEQVRACPEQDDIFALGGDAAAREKIRSQPVAGRIEANRVKPRPDPVQVAFLLFDSPGSSV
jgi:hypothetical protein